MICARAGGWLIAGPGPCADSARVTAGGAVADRRGRFWPIGARILSLVAKFAMCAEPSWDCSIRATLFYGVTLLSLSPLKLSNWNLP